MWSCKLIDASLLKWKKVVSKQSLGWREWQGLTQTRSSIAWGLRPCNTIHYPGQPPVRLASWAEGLWGFHSIRGFGVVNQILHTQPYQKYSSPAERLSRKNGDYFIWIYLGLWLINSLPTSLNIGVFWYHDSFLLLHKPSLLLRQPSVILRWFSEFPCFPQVRLHNGTRIILTLRPDDVKFFLKNMAFTFSPLTFLLGNQSWQCPLSSFHKSNY